MKNWLMACCLLLFSSVAVSAASEIFEFRNTEQAQRYKILIEELRCPKCQNQNLEDSNAGIAVDLRNQVYTMIQAGQTNEQIIDYMVARYGEFVLYRPVQDTSTMVLWYGPFMLLLIGAAIFLVVMLRNKKNLNKGAQ